MLLRISLAHGVGAKRQHATDLACHAANLAAQVGVAKDAADGAAQRLAHLANQVAEPSLRGHLALLALLPLLSLLQLLLLRNGLHQLRILLLLLLQLLLQLLDLLDQLLLLLLHLWVCHHARIGAERQHAPQAAGDAADGAAQAGITEVATDGRAQRTACLADQVANPALRRELLLLALLHLLKLLLILLLELLLQHLLILRVDHAGIGAERQ